MHLHRKNRDMELKRGVDIVLVNLVHRQVPNTFIH